MGAGEVLVIISFGEELSGEVGVVTSGGTTSLVESK